MGRKRAKNPFLLQTKMFHLHLHLLRLSQSGQQHETEKDTCERCIQRREKPPCDESSPPPDGSDGSCTGGRHAAWKRCCRRNGGLAYRTTAPTIFWDSIKAVAEAEVRCGERTSSDTPIVRSTKVGRVEHSSGEPTSSEFSGTTRTGSSEYDIAAPES